LEKAVKEGGKNNLVWSTNVPGERISLENESLENPIGKIVVKKILVRKPSGKSQFVSTCWKNYGEKTPSENSGKQTSAMCSLPRIVSVKLVVIGMVLKPVHK